MLTSYVQQAASKGVLLAVVLLYAFVSINRNYVWKDDYLLWKDTAHKSQVKARPHSNFALTAYKIGLFDEALAEAHKSIQFYYYHPDAHYIIGLVSYKKGDYDKAIKAFKWAILLTEKYLNNPKYGVDIHNSLGLAYEAAGYGDLASLEYEEAQRLKLFLK